MERNIESEVIVVLRVISQINNFPQSGWICRNPHEIAQRYSLRTLKGSEDSSTDFKELLEDELERLFREEQTMMVGCYQAADRSLTMLLYKLENATHEPTFIVKSFNEQMEEGDDSSDNQLGGESGIQPKDKVRNIIEMIVTDAHCIEDAHLRCVVSLRHPHTDHLFLFETQDDE